MTEHIERMKWIDIKDELPELGKLVLAYLYCQGIVICRRAYDSYEKNTKSDDIKWFKGSSEDLVTASVLYWMYLPSEPSDDNKSVYNNYYFKNV
jgi:hypothetical protein